MNLGLDEQVVFVAGSSRGIGRAIGEALLAEGANVVLTGRNDSALRDAQEELERLGHGDQVFAVAGDLSDASIIESAFERTLRRFGRIDHLVANLGTGAGKAGWDQPEEEWRRLFDINFFASTRLTRAVLPHLLSNPNGGSILHIASIAGIEASAAPLPYSAAKAALVSYSKNLARQLGSQNVRVNAIAPGNIFFRGGSWDKRQFDDPDLVDAMLKSEVPEQRFGTPREIASLAAYLCSNEAGFCTGACYVVDGGQTRSR
jgi:3-oxoacyl-[acyl-carrier protein] reductase